LNRLQTRKRILRKIELSTRTFAPLIGVGLFLSVSACSWIPDIKMPSMGESSSNAPLGQTVTGVSTRVEQRDGPGRKGGVTTGSDFAGAVVADEPNAALTARNILGQGGNAADAATALYFSLSVTYPAAAGLGGGGVCIAHDSKSGRTESIGFLPRRSGSGSAIAVPGNVRGFAALHARYGRLGWSSVVAPAERLAAVGMPVSRATAGQLADAGLKIAGNPSLAAMFGKEGHPMKELDNLRQLNLATTLALVRSQSTYGFYSGTIAEQLVAQSGGGLNRDNLQNYRPEIAPVQSLASGSVNVALPASSLGAGVFAASVWQNVGGSGNVGDVADAGQRAAISLGAGGSLDGDFGSTAFAVVDANGGAVACAVTMNGAFGSGRAAPGTGIVYAAAPPTGMSLASGFLMPVIVSGNGGKKLYFAGAGAGAPHGAAAIAHAAQATIGGNGQLAETLDTGPANARSPASAISCPNGLPGKGACILAVNPKGSGAGFSAVPPGT